MEEKELGLKVLSLLEKIAKQWGLGKPVGRVWGFLVFESKPVTQKRIEECVGYSRGLVSICLKKLREVGLINVKKEGKEMLYEANTSLIDGFEKVVMYFLENEIKPLIKYLSDNIDKIKDPALKSRASNAIQEYEKLKIGIMIFSRKMKKVSSFSVETLKDIAKLHDQ